MSLQIHDQKKAGAAVQWGRKSGTCYYSFGIEGDSNDAHALENIERGGLEVRGRDEIVQGSSDRFQARAMSKTQAKAGAVARQDNNLMNYFSESPRKRVSWPDM